jgi:hypothetical protein
MLPCRGIGVIRLRRTNWSHFVTGSSHRGSDVKYKIDFFPKLNVTATSVSGAIVGAPQPHPLIAWQPSTWPSAPRAVDEKFITTLKEIFEESVLGEVKNVIDDAHKAHGNLNHRGYVVALAMLCALDAIASYGYRNHHVADFIKAHFRPDYHPFTDEIYTLHRNSLVHSWHLFAATIYPDNTKIKSESGVVAFGLLDFFEELVHATQDFLNKLEGDPTLQKNTLARYARLQGTAKP